MTEQIIRAALARFRAMTRDERRAAIREAVRRAKGAK